MTIIERIRQGFDVDSDIMRRLQLKIEKYSLLMDDQRSARESEVACVTASHHEVKALSPLHLKKAFSAPNPSAILSAALASKWLILK